MLDVVVWDGQRSPSEPAIRCRLQILPTIWPRLAIGTMEEVHWVLPPVNQELRCARHRFHVHQVHL